MFQQQQPNKYNNGMMNRFNGGKNDAPPPNPYEQNSKSKNNNMGYNYMHQQNGSGSGNGMYGNNINNKNKINNNNNMNMNNNHMNNMNGGGGGILNNKFMNDQMMNMNHMNMNMNDMSHMMNNMNNMNNNMMNKNNNSNNDNNSVNSKNNNNNNNNSNDDLKPMPIPPSGNYGNNPYDNMNMYKGPDSLSGSSNGNNDDQSGDQNVQIDIGSYQQQQPAIINPDNMADLPDIPDIPPMAKEKNINLKPEEQKLNTHIGFVVKLNSRLVELNTQCRLFYPKLSKGLVDPKISEFQNDNFKKLIQSKELLNKKCSNLELQIQHLLPIKELNNKLQTELNKLRSLTQSLTSSLNSNINSNDYRDMTSKLSRDYVNTIEQQLNEYRQKTLDLSDDIESCRFAIKNSVSKLEKSQIDINNACQELQPLGDHLMFLEEEQIRLHAENEDLKKKIGVLNDDQTQNVIQINKYQKELDDINQKYKDQQSHHVAIKDQVEQHAIFQWKSQIQALEERLSKMTVARMQLEDDFAARQKQEQERADKYRAKYESVKQHVKTLEMQKVEYTRVNMQLRQQNNQFRTMITQLQNTIKMNAINNNNNPNGNQMNNNDKMKEDLLKLQQQQQPNHVQHHNHAMSYAQGLGAQQPPQQNNIGHQSVMSMPVNPMNGINNQMNNGNNNPHNPLLPPPNVINNNVQNNGFNPQDAMQQQMGPNGYNGGSMVMSGSQRNMIGPHRELWGKRTKVISEKGTKKRILVEWHFVTSDNQPHTVVLQHTQDTKPKTRRMLWVDGSEKYNNKSSASSFRIEIDKDVVVVSIDQLDQYQYRLTINNAAYTDAFKLWESRQQR